MDPDPTLVEGAAKVIHRCEHSHYMWGRNGCESCRRTAGAVVAGLGARLAADLRRKAGIMLEQVADEGPESPFRIAARIQAQQIELDAAEIERRCGVKG